MNYFLPLLADFANGIFAVYLASTVTGTEIHVWHFLVGIICALLPDIDAVPELMRRGKVAASSEYPVDHRTFFHFPLITVVVGGCLAMWLGYWGIVIWCALLLHIVNDLYGTGWGIKLWWPFSHTRYKFFARRVNQPRRYLEEAGVWSGLSESERAVQLMCSWSRSEFPAYMQKWGMEDWIFVYYRRLNVVSLIEYSLFLLALGLVVFQIFR